MRMRLGHGGGWTHNAHEAYAGRSFAGEKGHFEFFAPSKFHFVTMASASASRAAVFLALIAVVADALRFDIGAGRSKVSPSATARAHPGATQRERESCNLGDNHPPRAGRSARRPPPLLGHCTLHTPPGHACCWHRSRVRAPRRPQSAPRFPVPRLTPLLSSIVFAQCLGEFISKHDLAKGSYSVVGINEGERSAVALRVRARVSRHTRTRKWASRVVRPSPHTSRAHNVPPLFRRRSRGRRSSPSSSRRTPPAGSSPSRRPRAAATRCAREGEDDGG
jgi:hypothetical protein